MLRSARHPQFVRALRVVRAAHGNAVVWALTHPGHRDELLAAGVDRVIETPGTRFDVFGVPLSTILALRSTRFDVVVIPQMTVGAAGHPNLYRLAAVLGGRSFRIVTPEQDGTDLPVSALRTMLVRLAGARVEADVREAGARLSRAAANAVQRYDRPLFLSLAVAARLIPRRTASRRTGSRRTDRVRVLHVISTLGLGGAQVQLASLVNRMPAHYDIDVLVLCEPDGDFPDAGSIAPASPCSICQSGLT